MVDEVKHNPIDKAIDLLTAASAALAQKGDQHGDTEASFTMIAELWTVYIKHVAIIRGWTEVDSSDVAQMMVMLKIARSAYGSGDDNYVDAAGYTGIAGMLQEKAT
jgi:elongation factor P--beta-lysine ligase